MAKILSDNDIKLLLGKVIRNAEEKLINPNGIELRMGSSVRFLSTDEEMKIEPGCFLKVTPGDTVIITSLEELDFRREVVNEIFPDCSLMGLISPTTTMMREGISQVTTKIDPRFEGILNWGLRNGSHKDLILKYGEEIYKLTLFKLEEGELPGLDYGQRQRDQYHKSMGIAPSTRMIPADIPASRIVASSIEKRDVLDELQEAGYPFSSMAAKLRDLDGKFETVDKELSSLKGDFREKTDRIFGEILRLDNSITERAVNINSSIKNLEKSIREFVQTYFNSNFIKMGGTAIGLGLTCYSILSFFKELKFGNVALGISGLIFAILVFFITFLLTKNQKD